MAASHTLPHSQGIRKSGVLVLTGFGIRVQVSAGHLLAHDGIADERRTIRLPRVGHGLCRLVIIGSDGFITLEALRWISGVGASFLMLDRRGKVLVVTGPVSPSDARLRRAQALALGDGTALKISKELISQKLAGQELLARDMLHDSATADAIARFRGELPSADGIESVRLIEAQAAKAYWQAWADVPVHWPCKDEKRIPAHWKRFGSRISPLTHSPRLASSPPNALLNFLYGILESEARLSAVAMGLDPGIGCLHVDTPNRDSLACDIMEVCRAKVDGFVLNWLQCEPLRKSDFWEDRNGNCRIASSLAIKLCETADTWRKLVAPVAEYVAHTFWQTTSRSNRTKLPATNITQTRRRLAKGGSVSLPSPALPKLQRLCRTCGVPLAHGQSHCANCARPEARKRMIAVARLGRMATHTPEAEALRAAAQRQQVAARKAWQPSDKPDWLTKQFYAEKVQPRLAALRNSAIASALTVSMPYAAEIRAGRRRPHPRHWRALAELAGVSSDSLKSN